MLFREGPTGVIGIAQPAHAWVSGQLARAWGNAAFGNVAPRDELFLAAEQHDVGMAAWEAAPTVNRATGRPYSFLELPEPLHSAIFAEASRILVTQNRYAALLASRHFVGLAARHDLATDPPATARAIAAYLDSERAWQRMLLGSLRADPIYAAHCTDARLDRNSRLIAAWDWLSLRLLMGLRRPGEVPNVPTASGLTTLRLHPLNGDATDVAVAPWPFAAQAVEVVCAGRQIVGGAADDAALRESLAQGLWVTLRLTLRDAEM